MAEQSAAIVALGAELERVVNELTAEMHAEMSEQIPELPRDKPMLELLRGSIHSNLSAIVQVLSYDIEPDQVPVPIGAREYAHRLAQHGVSVTALVRAYRLGQRRLLEWALEEWEQSSTFRADQPFPWATVRELTRTTAGYIDAISEKVIEEYATERERWLAHRDRARADLLARLVAGEPIEVAAAERVLGYRLRQRHLGLVMWTVEQVSGRPEVGLFETVATRLGHEVGHGMPVLWPQDATVIWGWLPLGSGDDEVSQSVLGEALGERSGVHIAVGTVGAGLEGFRESHREATSAYRVASVPDRPAATVTSYGDAGVRAASMLAGDLGNTRRLVASTLGGLAADDESFARLRETLLTLLEERGNYVTTAERLHVHKNTVKYRVHKATEARGRSIDEGRLDLELALIACRWFGPAILQGHPDASIGS